MQDSCLNTILTMENQDGQKRTGQEGGSLYMAFIRARARFFLALLGLTLGACETAGLSSGPVLDTEKDTVQRAPSDPDNDDGGSEDDGDLVDNPDDPPVLVAYACEQENSCPSHRMGPWQLWTSGVLAEDFQINNSSQDSFFGQLEISVNRGEYYDLPRITSIYVTPSSGWAYLKVQGLPDKAMPLRDSVMQGHSVWELGTYSVQSQTVTRWWLTMRNSRWVSPVKAAVDVCLGAHQTGCHTLYLEVDEDFVL